MTSSVPSAHKGADTPRELCVSCGRVEGVARPTPLRSVVCGPCWAQHGGEAGAAEIGPAPALAVPVRDPRGQREWLERLSADELIADRHRPTRRRLLTLARELAYHADWDNFESWPTWARLMEVTGWARSTMAGWLRELRLRGWLTLRERGSTPEFRPMALRDAVEGNRAAVYALRVPLSAEEISAQSAGAEDETWTPTSFFEALKVGKEGGSSRARRVVHSFASWRAAQRQIEALRARIDGRNLLDFGVRPPVGGAQMLAAAVQLRPEHPILSRMSRKAIRAACRPFWAAGWTNVDVLHALEYRPTSWSALPSEADYQVTHPVGWVRSRLGAWRTERGRVLPGYTAHHRVREQVKARHGKGALDALPKNARLLTPADLLHRAQQVRQEAAETVARNQRRDRIDLASGLLPSSQPASRQARAAALDPAREQILAAAREHSRTQQPPPRPLPIHGAGGEGATAYERALARARAERGRHQR